MVQKIFFRSRCISDQAARTGAPPQRARRRGRGWPAGAARGARRRGAGESFFGGPGPGRRCENNDLRWINGISNGNAPFGVFSFPNGNTLHQHPEKSNGLMCDGQRPPVNGNLYAFVGVTAYSVPY
eukprot:gene15690-biopygen11247